MNKNIRVALICMVVGAVILITAIAIGSMGGRTPDVSVEQHVPLTDTQRIAMKAAIESQRKRAELNALTSHGTIATENGWSNVNNTITTSNGDNDVPMTTHTISTIGFSISIEVPDLKVVCLNGVQYWSDNDRDMRSESLAPKYSPGNRYPDICAE
jgi:hypothetical protein